MDECDHGHVVLGEWGVLGLVVLALVLAGLLQAGAIVGGFTLVGWLAGSEVVEVEMPHAWCYRFGERFSCVPREETP